MQVTQAHLDAIRRFDTCTIANAIERFRVRLRNEGFTLPGLHCRTPDASRLIGFAAPCRVRSADPPMTGNRYQERTDWWQAIGAVSAPRIAVLETKDPGQGIGAFVGEVHAAVLQAFGCAGVITNGAVRDLSAVNRLGFSMFSGSVAVSHAYFHLVDFGKPVEIFGLQIAAGDLLFADEHGVISIPPEIVPDLPRVAAELQQHDRAIVALCQSPEFSQDKLLQAIHSDQH